MMSLVRRRDAIRECEREPWRTSLAHVARYVFIEPRKQWFHRRCLL